VARSMTDIATNSRVLCCVLIAVPVSLIREVFEFIVSA